MRIDDDGLDVSVTAMSLSHVEVDIDGLDDFRAFLGRELDTNLRPGADGVRRDHALGVGFGAGNPGQGFQAASQRYGECLATSTANLAAYIDAAEVLIDAIARISAKYRDADAASANLNAELTQALQDAQQARVTGAQLGDAQPAPPAPPAPHRGGQIGPWAGP